MNSRKSKKQLSGIITPLVTPLLDKDTLDIEGLERLIEHVISGGVHGLLILGTTGEGPSLSYNIRTEMIVRVCRQVKSRIPVLVNISDTSFAESLNKAEVAAKSNAFSLAISPTYYYPHSQGEFLEYLERLTKELPLPLYLYNLPSHCKFQIEPKTVFQASLLPGIVGIKDSSADLTYFNRVKYLLKENKKFKFFIGCEEMLAETLLMGAHGGVVAGSNLFPMLFVKLYKAAKNLDIEKVKILHDKILLIRNTIYSVGKNDSSLLKGLKCSLSFMNICNDFMAEPFRKFREMEKEMITRHMKALNEELASI